MPHYNCCYTFNNWSTLYEQKTTMNFNKIPDSHCFQAKILMAGIYSSTQYIIVKVPEIYAFYL